MNNKIIVFGFLLKFVFLASTSFASNEVSLSDILKHQKSDSNQKNLIESKSTEKYSSNRITYSPWLTEVNSTLELKSNFVEDFTNRQRVETSSLPWNNRLIQRTPYGLSFQLDYNRELREPELSGFFQSQRYRATVFLSLFNDFLGSKSREVIYGESSYQTLLAESAEAENCVETAKNYVDVLTNSKKLMTSQKSLKELKKIHSQVKRASRRGAISSRDRVSIEVDMSNLEAQVLNLTATHRDASLKLQNQSGYSVEGKDLVNLTSLGEIKPATQKIDSKHLTVLKEEISILKRRRHALDLESGRDLSLYAGKESSEFNEINLNQGGSKSFDFIGLQVSWRFGDNSLKNSKAQLSAAISLKESEFFNRSTSDNKRMKEYALEVNNLSKKLKDLTKITRTGKSLERKALKRFKNGNSKYFEFLSIRNQSNSLKNSTADTEALLWRRYVDYLFLSGQYKKLCNGGA